MPRYPFEFHQADALEVLAEVSDVWDWRGHTFDAIHASPPCQDYSKAMRHLSGTYPRLIEPVRDSLAASGLPWIIENVAGAPLPVQSDMFGRHGTELCGSMFGLEMAGLQIRRHRLFETSFPIAAPRGCDHSLPAFNPHNGGPRGRERIYEALGRRDPEKPWLEAMGVEWMHRYEGREAIPPAYTEYIGRQLLDSLEHAA